MLITFIITLPLLITTLSTHYNTLSLLLHCPPLPPTTALKPPCVLLLARYVLCANISMLPSCVLMLAF